MDRSGSARTWRHAGRPVHRKASIGTINNFSTTTRVPNSDASWAASCSFGLKLLPLFNSARADSFEEGAFLDIHWKACNDPGERVHILENPKQVLVQYVRFKVQVDQGIKLLFKSLLQGPGPVDREFDICEVCTAISDLECAVYNRLNS